MAWYNENDSGAAATLRELIKAGLIAAGDVDERDIRDVKPRDLKGYTQCHFFAGFGMWSYALRLAGWPDGQPVWTGSCPCQPFSSAGRGAGFADERHLWPAWHHFVAFWTPDTIFGEQVADRGGLAWIDLVCSDLEGSGYAIGAFDLCAAGFGAPHRRQRLYWVADSHKSRSQRRGVGRHGAAEFASRAGGLAVGVADDERDRAGPVNGFWRACDWLYCRDDRWRPVEPGAFPLVDGAAARVGRLRGYGNGLVAPQAAGFIQAYSDMRAAA